MRVEPPQCSQICAIPAHLLAHLAQMHRFEVETPWCYPIATRQLVPRCFRWNRGEAEKSDWGILEGCQKVAGGRAKRYPRFSQGKKSHPGRVPERLFCAEHLASRRDAGMAAHAPGVSSHTALLNPRLPSGIPLGWPREACGPSPTPSKTPENQNTLFIRRELRFFGFVAVSTGIEVRRRSRTGASWRDARR